MRADYRTTPAALIGEFPNVAKDLPYYRWYPKDAESDERFSLMDIEAEALFRRLLDRSWINDGLPNDIGSLVKSARCSVEFFERWWPQVKPLFAPGEDGRLRNKRLEEERALVVRVSDSKKRPGNRNRLKHKPVASIRKCEIVANVCDLRASDSDSVSESISSGDARGLPEAPQSPQSPRPPRSIPMPSQSFYPLTIAAIRKHDPAVDERFVNRLHETTVRYCLSSDSFPKKYMPNINDEWIAKAVNESYKIKPDHGTGLLLSRVPPIMVTWSLEE